jgi:hypothetical protein
LTALHSDAAIALGFEYGGWCPRGGWAENLTTPPGLLGRYPALMESPIPRNERAGTFAIATPLSYSWVLPGSLGERF